MDPLATVIVPARRRLARVLVILTLMVAPAAVISGCGAASHYIGSRIGHSVATHLIGAKRADKLFCFDNVYQTVHDFTHHHLLFGALSLHQALKNCEAGYSKNAR